MLLQVCIRKGMVWGRVVGWGGIWAAGSVSLLSLVLKGERLVCRVIEASASLPEANSG